MIAALALASLAGCATDKARIEGAARTSAQAGLVDKAIEAGSKTPDLPADCRRQERSGVKVGDRLDIAALKTDAALSRANARVARCAAWHDEIRKGTGQQ